MIKKKHTYVDGITKFEKVRIIGVRATQIANGALSTIEIGDMTDALEIATAEFYQGKIPIIITRLFPNNRKEDVHVSKKI